MAVRESADARRTRTEGTDILAGRILMFSRPSFVVEQIPLSFVSEVDLPFSSSCSSGTLAYETSLLMHALQPRRCLVLLNKKHSVVSFLHYLRRQGIEVSFLPPVRFLLDWRTQQRRRSFPRVEGGYEEGNCIHDSGGEK